MPDITTVKDINRIFKNISERHLQINSYGWGANWEITTEEKTYSLLWVTPADAEMIKSESNDRYTSLNITLSVKVLDLVKKDESNEKDVESSTLQILTDVINEFNDHSFYQNKNMELEGNVTLEPLDEFTDDNLTGWQSNITIRMRNITSSCGIPVSGDPT